MTCNDSQASCNISQVAIGPFKPIVRITNHKFVKNLMSPCIGERSKRISTGMQSGIHNMLVLRGIFTVIILLFNWSKKLKSPICFEIWHISILKRLDIYEKGKHNLVQINLKTKNMIHHALVIHLWRWSMIEVHNSLKNS